MRWVDRGAVRYKYTFNEPQGVNDVADRFHDLTGLAMTVTQQGDGWALSAHPLRGSVELVFEGNTVRVIPRYEHWLGGSYFSQCSGERFTNSVLSGLLRACPATRHNDGTSTRCGGSASFDDRTGPVLEHTSP